MKCWIASREPVGIAWTAAGEMGRMQELSPAALDAILVLADPHCSHTLQIDEGVKRLACHGIILFA